MEGSSGMLFLDQMYCRWKKHVHVRVRVHFLLVCMMQLFLPLLEVEFCLQVVRVAAAAGGGGGDDSTTIRFLPGFDGPLPFHLETGYIGVGETEQVQLFYYMIKSESDHPQNDPLLLWLTGGPACSGFSALVYEIGPLNFDPVRCPGTVPKLSLNPHSWTKVANIIFLDLPVGTGFSYATTPEASHSTDLQACDHAYEFLRKWIVEHPDYMFNPFYVGGDSYAGITVPIVTKLISDGNDAGVEPRIDLKGYMMGNPLVSGNEINFRPQFAHGKGLISDEFYETFKQTCGDGYSYLHPPNVLCSNYVDYFEQQLVSTIDYAQVLEPYCLLVSPKPNKLSYGPRSLNEILRVKPPHDLNPPQCTPYTCRMDSYHLSYYWANDERVRASLHVRKGTTGMWERCSADYSPFYTATLGSSLPYVKNLTIKGYRTLIYSGDHDMVVPFFGTEAWIRSLKYPIVDEWRQWIVQGQVAGYTRTYAHNLTFATVKGGGHTAPEYKRPECKAMLERWLSSRPL